MLSYDDEINDPAGWREANCPFYARHQSLFYCGYCGTCAHGFELACPNDSGQHMGQADWRWDRRNFILFTLGLPVPTHDTAGGKPSHDDCDIAKNWPCLVCQPTLDYSANGDCDLIRGADALWKNEWASDEH